MEKKRELVVVDYNLFILWCNWNLWI